MTKPFTVEWTEDALDCWRRLSLDDARAVAEAVEVFATGRGGTALFIDGQYMLLVGVHVVLFWIDYEGDTLYVTWVRHA